MADNTEKLCRTRLVEGFNDPYMPQEEFNIDACGKCLLYLFMPDKAIGWYNFTGTAALNANELPNQLANFCRFENIEKTACSRWKNCCTSAVSCCQDQIDLWQPGTAGNDGNCPATWDGIGCFRPTPPGSAAEIVCPETVVSDTSLQSMATKFCTETGSWFNNNGSEFTDYMPCYLNEEQWNHHLMIVKLTCEIISVISLVISIFLFLYCRKLYRSPQKAANYHVHTYTFFALLFYAASCLLGETLLYFRALSPFQGCQIITMMTRFFMNFAYAAMSVEAFYLHWNVSNTFNRIHNPAVLMVVGLAAPFVVNLVYVTVMLTVVYSDNSTCWLPVMPYEWIIYGFNISCLAFNFVLLVSLFRIILKLNIKTSYFQFGEVSPFRSAMQNGDFQTLLIFVTLFGIPLILLIFPPPYKGAMYMIYQLSSNSLQMLQGTFASIFLCFFSKDVRSAFLETGLCKTLSPLFHSCKKEPHATKKNTKPLLNGPH